MYASVYVCIRLYHGECDISNPAPGHGFTSGVVNSSARFENGIKIGVADVVRATCRVSNLNGPVLLPEGFCQWCVTYRLSGTLDRLRKLDMVQHCKWIAYEADCFGCKGCTRMRPNLKLHLPVFGHAFRVTGFMA
jgi:hypothetical protein